MASALSGIPGLQHIAFSVENIHAADAELAAEGPESILEYRLDTVQSGLRFRVEEAYLGSGEFVGGTTVQLIEITPL